MPSPVHYGQLRVIKRTLTHGAKISSFVDVLGLNVHIERSCKHVLCLLSLKELSEILENMQVVSAYFSIVQSRLFCMQGAASEWLYHG